MSYFHSILSYFKLSKDSKFPDWKHKNSFQINYLHNWQIGEGSDRTLVRSNVGIQFSSQRINIVNLDNNKVVMQQEVLIVEDKYFEKAWHRVYYIKNAQLKEIVLLGDSMVVFYKGEKGLMFANMEPKFIDSLPDISTLTALK